MGAPPPLAVIVPMFNEERNAARCVQEVCAVLSSRLPGSCLFAVDDGSRDRTAEILGGFERQSLPFAFVRCPVNQGYGAALVSGARAARQRGFDYGVFMDSDLTNDPALLPSFAERFATGRYDLIKASRYVDGGGMRNVPLRRQIPTRLGNWLARRLFGMGIHDCTNGFRGVRLELISDVQFHERGFPQILEEMWVLKRKGARATEFPYLLTARNQDQGESKFSYRPRVLLSYLKYALLAGGVRYRPRA